MPRSAAMGDDVMPKSRQALMDAIAEYVDAKVAESEGDDALAGEAAAMFVNVCVDDLIRDVIEWASGAPAGEPVAWAVLDSLGEQRALCKDSSEAIRLAAVGGYMGDGYRLPRQFEAPFTVEGLYLSSRSSGEDTARLDWIEAEILRCGEIRPSFAHDEHSDGMIEPAYDFKGGFQYEEDCDGAFYQSFREAIDAARGKDGTHE